MNRQEFENYQGTARCAHTISVEDLDDGDHTLAYGYTCDRDTWHAYVFNDEIHVLIYPHQGDPLLHRHARTMDTEDLRPDKRVYPDTVNEIFARLMRNEGTELPFLGNFDWTTPDVARRAAKMPFKGKTHLDF